MSTALRQHLSARVVDVRRRAAGERSADPDASAGPETNGSGFVLLEEIVSITLLMIVMAALATFFLTVTQSTTYERARQSAVQLANSEMDAVNAVSAGDLYQGRNQAAVTAEFNTPAALSPAIAPALATMDPAVDTNAQTMSATPTLPITESPVPTLNNIHYTVTNYLGLCSIPATSAQGTACTKTSTAPAGSTAYIRAVVAVTWPGNHCPSVNGAGLCTYVTSSLISAAGDPTFNLCTLGAACGPAAPQLVNPGNQFTVVNGTAALQMSLVSYTGVAPITWSATGLPSWLSINTSTGLISGTAPSLPAAGVTVTVTATDAFARTAQTSFTWTVVLPPTITGLTTPYVTTAGLAIPSQTLPYTCPTSSCTYSLAGAPSGIGLATSSTGTGAATQTVTNTSGNLYLVGVVASSAAVSTNAYPTDVTTQKASNYWRLDETSGTTGVDSIGGNNLVEQAGVTHGAAGGIATNSDGASTFDGAADGTASTTTAVTGPTTFSESIWFKTTTTAGGKLLGFGNAATGSSSTYDRQIVMDNAGHLDFGVYNGNTNVVATSNSYNDGKWHQAVGTLSPTGGMVFYVDGVNVGSNAAVTTPQANVGYWRLGGDNVAGWSPQPSSYYFAGTLDDASIYPSALAAAQVQQQYSDSQGTAYTVTATPKDVITGTVGAVDQAAWTVLPPIPPTITGLVNPFVTTASATISSQPLPYTCASGNCTYTLAGAPTGIGLSTSATAAGPFTATATVTGSTSGTLYLRGTVDPAAATSAAYANDVASQGATNYWHLGEASGTSGADAIGGTPLTESAGVGHGAPGAIFTAPGTASTFDGSSLGTARTQSLIAAPSTFSESIWFRTTTTLGGQLIGFGDSRTDARSGSHDRQLYMDTSGRVIFGVSPSAGATSVVVSTGTYNDGAWHQAVATMKSGSGGGQTLYIDGKSVGTPQAITTTTPYNGYWRLGGDDLTAWPAGPASNFTGTLDEASIYPTALTAAQILQQYSDGVAASYSVTITPTDTVTGIVGTPNTAAWTVDPVPTLTGMVTPFTTTAGATIATQPLPYTCPSTSCTETLTGAPAGIGLNVADTGSPQSSVSTITSTSGNVYLRGTVGSAAGTSNAYATDIQTPALGATNYWRLGEASGTTGTDLISGGSNLTYGTGVGHGALGAIFTSTDTASTFSGAADGSGTASSQASVAAPAQLSESIWFKTTTTAGGWLMGMTNVTTGSGNYDRVLYLDNSGHVVSMLYNGTFQRTTSPGTYNDGSWHQAVVTVSPTLGVSLYVDGSLVSANASYTSNAFSGYWRIGGGGRLVTDLPNISSNYFQGSLDEPAVFSTALGAGDVSKQYLDAQRVAYSLTGTPTDAATGVNGPVNAASWIVRPAPVVSGLVTPFSTTAGATITPQPLSYSCPAGICTITLTGAPAGIGLSTTATGAAQPSVAVNVTTGPLYLVGTVGATVTPGAFTLSVTPEDTASQFNGPTATSAWTVLARPTVTGLTANAKTTVGATIPSQTLAYTCPGTTCSFTVSGGPGGIGLATAANGTAATTVSPAAASSGTIYLVGTSTTTGTYTLAVTPTDTSSGVSGTAATAAWTVYPTPTVTGLTTPFSISAGATIANQTLTYTCPTGNCSYTLAGAPTGIGLSTTGVAGSGATSVTVAAASGSIYLIGTVNAATPPGLRTVSVTPKDLAYTVTGTAATAAWTVGVPTVSGLTTPFSTTVGATIASQALPFTCPSLACSFTVSGHPSGIGLDTDNVGAVSNVVTVTAASGSIYLRGTVGAVTPGTYTVVVTPKDTANNVTGAPIQATWTVYAAPTVNGLVTPFTTTAGATLVSQALPYTCPSSSCTYTLAGAPSGVGLNTNNGTTVAGSLTVTGSTSGTIYLRGTVSASATPSSTAYTGDVRSQGASNYWRLDEATGTTGVDSISGTGNAPLTEQAGIGHGVGGAIASNSDTASTFDGSSVDGSASTQTAIVGPQTFSESVWFKTTTTSGGRLFGFSNSTSGISSNYDRQIYMDNSGALRFGTCGVGCNGVPSVITTAGSYNDGQWHQVVGTLSSAGMSLYVDGTLIGTNTAVTTAQVFTGYWRLGGDNLGAWPGTVSSQYFAGTLDDVSIYPTALTPVQIQQQYSDSGRVPYSVTVTPADAATGVQGTSNQAAWTVYSPPVITGLTTPFTTTAGAVLANQTLPYSCPGGSCTVALTGAPAGVGISTASTGSVATSATVTAPSGVLYLRGTVSPSASGPYSVAVTPTDTSSTVVGTASQASWTVLAAPTVTGLPSSSPTYLGEVIPTGALTLSYTCPSLQCTFTVGGGLTGVGIGTTTGATPTTSVSVTTASGNLYVSGTVAAVAGTYSVSVTPLDTSSGVSGTPNTAVATNTGPTITGQTAPLTTSVGATIANDAVTYTCPSSACTFAVAGAPSGIGLYASATGTTSGSPSVTVTNTSGTLYLRGTILASTATGTSTVGITYTENTTAVSATASSAGWTLLAAMILNSPGTASAVRGILISKAFTYTCRTTPCTVSVSGAPPGIGLSSVALIGSAASVNVNAGSGTLYLQGIPTAAGTYPITLTMADPAGSTITTSVTWTVS